MDNLSCKIDSIVDETIGFCGFSLYEGKIDDKAVCDFIDDQIVVECTYTQDCEDIVSGHFNEVMTLMGNFPCGKVDVYLAARTLLTFNKGEIFQRVVETSNQMYKPHADYIRNLCQSICDQYADMYYAGEVTESRVVSILCERLKTSPLKHYPSYVWDGIGVYLVSRLYEHKVMNHDIEG